MLGGLDRMPLKGQAGGQARSLRGAAHQAPRLLVPPEGLSPEAGPPEAAATVLKPVWPLPPFREPRDRQGPGPLLEAFLRTPRALPRRQHPRGCTARHGHGHGHGQPRAPRPAPLLSSRAETQTAVPSSAAHLPESQEVTSTSGLTGPPSTSTGPRAEPVWHTPGVQAPPPIRQGRSPALGPIRGLPETPVGGEGPGKMQRGGVGRLALPRDGGRGTGRTASGVTGGPVGRPCGLAPRGGVGDRTGLWGLGHRLSLHDPAAIPASPTCPFPSPPG